MSDTPKIVIEDALNCDPSLFISCIPTPPFDRPRIKENWFALVNEVNRLQPIERELADLKALHAWRPIETAPKDGTWLMLWQQWSDVPFIGRWLHDRWCVSHEHVDAQGGWDGAVVVDSVTQKDVTHWQPLPEPPKGSAE